MKNDYTVYHSDTLTLDGRKIELVHFINSGEMHGVFSDTMIQRAEVLGAMTGEKEGNFVHLHSGEIPAHFQSLILVFPAWRGGEHMNPKGIGFLKWDLETRYWVRGWGGAVNVVWSHHCLLVKFPPE